ncbi:LamG-like jellyroll fold domain-containing protein [Streptomyces sp. 21So2-11]|uniref:LamG-like jellyroll fold domain-containing protein n=1 Tax=Streptomyces sp. 21So2-11 TaxID=3144408 RepID=UPI00321B4745
MNITTDRRRRHRSIAVTGVLMAGLTAALVGLPSGASGIVPDAAAAAPTTTKSAQGEQAAQNAAAKSGAPVEVLALRDERTETFANPDGTFTAKEYVQPVRTRKNGKWADLDTTLAKQINGSYAPVAATTGMAFSGGGSKIFATIERAGKTISLAWPHKLPVPTVEGSTATYANVLPEVDLVVRAENDGFSHLLVVKSAEAAANPELASIELPVETQGVELNKREDGGLVAEDTNTGGEVFEAPQPMMWDSSHDTSPATAPQAPPTRPTPHAPSAKRASLVTAKTDSPSAALSDTADPQGGPAEGAQVADVGLAMSSDTMVLTPDSSLLKSADTVYPVYIDPVTKTSTRTGWTMISSHYPSAEFWKFSEHEGLGRCPSDVSYQCASTDDRKRHFFAIPTGSYEGKTILEAEFAVTMVHTYDTSGKSVELGRVNSTSGSAISSGTNWSNQPSLKETIASQSPTNPAGSCTSTNQNVRFNVKSTVQKAADSGWDTTTFRLKAGSEDNYAYWKRFCGNAHLEVKYNRAPYQPKMSELSMNYGGSCEYGAADEHYADQVPTLRAVIRDPDHNDAGGNTEKLRAKFKIYWTSGGTTKTYLPVAEAKQTHNVPRNDDVGYATFSYKVGSDVPGDGVGAFSIPQNAVIGWEVQGLDDASAGPWSSAGDAATRCQFIYDSTKPKAPVVTSSGYPDDDVWHDGVGDYGSFVMDSPSTDVTQYRYRFTGQPGWKTVPAQSTGGPATIRFMPDREGPFTLEAKAVDGAGHTQETAVGHTFLVNDGRAPKAAWSLGDPAGSAQAAGSAGAPAARAGSGVRFGVPVPGRANETSVLLDGTKDAYLDAGKPAVDTSKSFSVSAWVSLSELPDTPMAVVSQDGTAEPGFTLGYDGESRMWSFRAPASEIESLGSWKVAGAKAQKNIPTHLIGVYDAEHGQMRMYVNGYLIKNDIVARGTAWNAGGALQIGRALALDDYRYPFKGQIADVEVYDRVITESEGRFVGGIPPHQLAYWPLDDAVAGSTPEVAGGTALGLAGSSSIYQPDESCDPNVDPECPPVAEPLWGDGHLALNGSTDYASRGSGLLPAEGSFTLTARARLASPTATKDQTVLSLPSTTRTAVVVRYSKTADRWQLAVTDKDAAGAVATTVSDTAALPADSGDGDHLALVYDALFGEARLYVNGQFAGAQTAWRNTWDFSKTSVQIGRNLAGATGGEYFSGALDEARVYQGALDSSTVATVAGLGAGSSLTE